MDEDKPKRRGRPPKVVLPKLYKNTSGVKQFTSTGKVMPDETCELSDADYALMKDRFSEVST